MRALIWLLIFCCNACWCMHTVRASRDAPELWLAPLQPLVRPDGTEAGSADYFDLFKSEAAWQTVATHATVFQIYPELLRSASDADLQRMGAWLDNHKIALGLETKILTRTAWCVAGNAHRPWMVDLIGRLKRLGLNLQRLAMVGPLVDGHIATGYGACQRSIAEVADDAANTVRLIRELFPNVA